MMLGIVFFVLGVIFFSGFCLICSPYVFFFGCRFSLGVILFSRLIRGSVSPFNFPVDASGHGFYSFFPSLTGDLTLLHLFSLV